MVFCYKIITDSPRRSTSVSPRKKSASPKCHYLPNSMSELIASVDYEGCGADIDSIPERDWRLLAALARKREENEERERLAEQFRTLWQKEKQQREMIEAETSEEFKRYVHEKRARERSCLEWRQFQRSLEQQLKRGELMDLIECKEQRCAALLALNDDRKMNDMMGRAMEGGRRALLAADRRTRKMSADERRRGMQLVYAKRREDDACKRRSAMLRDAAQRAAIGNALSSWESALLRQELGAEEAARRAQLTSRVSCKHARASKWASERDIRLRRTRRLAALTARLRNAVIGGRQ
ncbi:unnamed protein product, partial [Iphiclides podalirius]